MTAPVRPVQLIALVRRLASSGAAAVLTAGVLAACTAPATVQAVVQPGRAVTSASPTSTATPVPTEPCHEGTVATIVAFSALPAGTFTQRVESAAGRAVRIPASSLAFHDFTRAQGTIDGGVLGPQASGLIGAGGGKTVFTVAPHTSTHARDVPKRFPATNQLYVLRIAGDRTVLRGFGVVATEQGHLYNGLRVGQVRGLRASHIRVTGIPGDASAPPGETFGINDYRTVGSQWSHIVVDGAGVGASGFATNGSRNVLICATVSKHNRYGMGFAFWKSSGIRCVDCSAIDNGRAGFNFERVTGSNELIRPIATGNTYGVRISNDQGTGRYRIVDPQLTDGHFTVTVPYRYAGRPNRQKLSDITLVIHGKVRRDLLRIQRY